MSCIIKSLDFIDHGLNCSGKYVSCDSVSNKVFLGYRKHLNVV